jgi:hypothetical protein
VLRRAEGAQYNNQNGDEKETTKPHPIIDSPVRRLHSEMQSFEPSIQNHKTELE